MATQTDSRAELRFYPYYLLRDHDIPCVVWFEDALGYYGVKTVVFDLHILVHDIDLSAQILVEHGWTVVQPDPNEFDDGLTTTKQRRLEPPKVGNEESAQSNEQTRCIGPRPLPPPPSQKPPGPARTLLLPAEDWHYELPDIIEASMGAAGAFPTLPDLVDSLIETLLDACEVNVPLWHHMAVLVGYAYMYIPALKARSFAEQLKYEHRQYHYDIMAGISYSGLLFARHERKIRDALRRGTYQLVECSASRDNEDLFREARDARLYESMFGHPPSKYPASKRGEDSSDEY